MVPPLPIIITVKATGLIWDLFKGYGDLPRFSDAYSTKNAMHMVLKLSGNTVFYGV
jgi:hypothetical protein